MHITNIKFESGGQRIGKAILLDDVIENLELTSDYYAQRTMSYVLGQGHALWKVLEEAGAIPSYD